MSRQRLQHGHVEPASCPRRSTWRRPRFDRPKRQIDKPRLVLHRGDRAAGLQRTLDRWKPIALLQVGMARRGARQGLRVDDLSRALAAAAFKKGDRVECRGYTA